MTIKIHILIIQDFVPRLRKKVESLSAEQLTTHYIKGEWTIAQNVHHLLDAHTNSYQLFKRVLSEDGAKLSWPKQEIVAELPDGKSSNIQTSLLALEGLHARWTDMLNHILDWSKSGTSSTSGKVYTLEKLLDMYANHCDNHIQQIQELLENIP